ncbi:hypothetical protein [Mesorhizobium sp. BE184]|uniref:hypothetical protein n=1 Tax=Mesorhizobium sp. BE184 TaxID=2817714 RepID=UPI0028650104|nr:hypothetical protein [Mesorhizobium sp. BE184]MDR7033331.1 hypothetical protein [Mesorhizobium sp. BE184]
MQSIYTLALEAIAVGRNLSGVIDSHGFGETVDLERLATEGELDVPVRHPDPAHMILSGTGTHTLGFGVHPGHDAFSGQRRRPERHHEYVSHGAGKMESRAPLCPTLVSAAGLGSSKLFGRTNSAYNFKQM